MSHKNCKEEPLSSPLPCSSNSEKKQLPAQDLLPSEVEGYWEHQCWPLPQTSYLTIHSLLHKCCFTTPGFVICICFNVSIEMFQWNMLLDTHIYPELIPLKCIVHTQTNVQKTSPPQFFPRINVKEVADRQTMQNFTFSCCIFPLTHDIHLDKKIDISCALIQRDLQHEDVIKLFYLCQLSGSSVRRDLDHDTFKCCVKWPTHMNLKKQSYS